MDAHALARSALTWLSAWPPWLSLGACGLTSGGAYVFPLIPHDVVVLAGALLAARGAFPPALLVVVVTVASVAGALGAWRIGLLGATRPGAMRFMTRFMSAESFERTAARYRRWGRGLLLANRFLPGIRATLFFGAGLFRVEATDVALYGALSALVWNSLLVTAGVLLGENLDDVIDVLEEYGTIGWTALGVIVVGLIARALWKRRRRSAV